MNREIEINSSIRLSVIVLAFLSAGAAVWACVDHQAVHAAVGLIAMLIVTSPFLVIRRYDLFSPWTFVLLAVGVMATPQAICTTFSFPDVEKVDRMMLLRQPPEYFFYPSLIYLLGWLCLTIGYFSFPFRPGQAISIGRDFNNRNATIVLGVSLLVSLAATGAYIKLTGGASSSRISSKRTTIETLDVGASEQRQHGYLRHFGKLAAISFVITYSYLLTRNKKVSPVGIGVVAVAFLLACALPFYSSSRSQICWVILYALGINYYLSPKRFAWKVLAVGSVGIVLFVMMSFLRTNDTQDALQKVNLAESFEKLILNRNGPGLSKTAHIISHIPDPLAYQYGKTIGVWFLAPVPREIFPNKPLIHSGPIIGTSIYGTRVSGVPPGLIAELYWNFHIPGVIFGMLLIGFVFQRIHAFFRRCQLAPGIIVPVYLFAITPAIFNMLGNSIGYGLVIPAVDFITITIVLFFCTTPIAPIAFGDFRERNHRTVAC